MRPGVGQGVPGASVQADADAGPGEIATANGRVPQAASDADLPPGWMNENGHAVLSQQQAQIAAKLIMQAPEEQRPELVRQFRERFGEAVMEQVAERLSPEGQRSAAADRLPNEVQWSGPVLLGPSDRLDSSSRGPRTELVATPQSFRGSIRGTNKSANNGLGDPEIKRKCTHQFCVQRDWRLQQKAGNWGWIIQRVTVETSWFDENGHPHHDVAHFYEAWYVPKGSDRPTETTTHGDPPYPNDFVGFDGKEGTRGDVKFTVSARFYEGLNLDGERFKRHNADAYAGRLLATVPTETPQDLEFRNPDGSAVPSTGAVDRTWTHSWGWR